MTLDAEIDRLYGLTLDEFVSERDALAKRLRKDGDRDAADTIKALRKPTVGAWAINQAARRRVKERDGLLTAGDRLRKAHEALLSGGDPSTLRKAMAKERELAATLADAAEAIATETGKGGPALKERVRGTLHAAAVDDEVRDELAAGRVVRERDAVGLGPFGAVTVRAGGRTGAGGRNEAATRGKASRSGAKAGGAKAGGAKAGGAKAGGATRGKARGGTADKRAEAAERKRAEREQAAHERAEREQAEREHAEQVTKSERSVAAAHTALAKAETAHEEVSGVLDTARRALREAEAAERDAGKAKRERAKEAAKRDRELQRLRASAPRRR